MRGSYIIALAALALVGCRKEQSITLDEPIQTNMMLSGNIKVEPVNSTKITPSDQTAGGVFELGDQIGLYLIPETPHSTASGYHEMNCNMLFNAQEVITDGVAKNLFVPVTPVKYYQYELHNLYCYYPYQAANAPVHTTEAGKMLLDFQIKDDQNKTTTVNAKAISNYSLSDLLWATKTDIKPQESAVVSVVSMDFSHKMANIVVKLTNSDGQPFFGDDAPEASLFDVERAAALNIETGALTAPQTGKSSVGNSLMKSFTSYVKGTTKEMEYRAVMPPQTINDKQTLFRIRILGINYEMVKTGGAVNLEGGKQYVFNVKNTGVDFYLGGCEVEDWNVVPVQNVTSPGDGLPHKLLFPFVDEATAVKVKSATLNIDGVDRATVDVTYDAAVKMPTLFYEMATSFEDKLNGYKLYDVDGKLLKQTSGLNLQIAYNQNDELFYFPVLDYSAMPANCYVIYSPYARVKFNALKKPVARYSKGNPMPVNVTGANPSTVDAGLQNDIAYAVGDVIEVAWQTAVDHGTTGGATNMVVQSFELGADGMATVNVGGVGNAVLSYKRAGVVLWNYHIWVTDGNPFATHYAAGDNVNGKVNGGGQAQFMDRNLGALASTTAQPAEADAYKYFGLLYQHGRPTPFTGQGIDAEVYTYASIYNGDGIQIASGSIGGYTSINSVAPTVTAAIQTPNTFYSELGGTESFHYTWYKFADISLWSDYGINKSIYDPCPYGYRVPNNGSWTGFPSTTWTQRAINGGAIWRSIWWPASSYREANGGAIYTIGDSGWYWSSSRSSYVYCSSSMYFYYEGDVTTSTNNIYRGCGFSVRCVQEGY